MKCPRCQQENPAHARFCLGCGARLALACASCGAELPGKARFCLQCGHAVAAGSAAASPSPAPEAYTPKHLAEKILTSKAALEGERKQVTVLFADLKGSMELLADRDPEEARKLLDPVLKHMMEAVHRYEGTVNQVMGDGIMALFGAPLAHEDHAVRACYAALRMQETVKRYAEGVRREYGITIRIRVGLNSGEVVVRAIGSDLHMDYTAVGQTTHLAARMEQLADPGTILFSPATLELADGYVEVKPLGPLPVKGLSEPMEVYQTAEFLYEARLFPDLEYTFKHALTHEVTYGGLLQERRRDLHTRIAHAIETRHPDRLAEQIERLAHHAVRGELGEKAVHYLRQAGLKAAGRSALKDALSWFETGLRVLETLPESLFTLEQAFDIRLQLRSVLSSLGEIPLLQACLSEAETLAERLNDDARRGTICAFMINAYVFLGRPADARASGIRALTIARRLQDLKLQVLATSYLNSAYYDEGEYQRVVELATQNLDAWPGDWSSTYPAAAPVPIHDRYWLVLSLSQLGRFGEGIEYGREMIHLAEASQNAWSVSNVYYATGTLHLFRGEFDRARSLLERGLIESRTRDVFTTLRQVMARYAWALAELGDVEEALKQLQESEQLLDATGTAVGQRGGGYHALGCTCLLIGRLDEAERFANRAIEATPWNLGTTAHALQLLGDISTHPDRFDAGSGELRYREALALAEPRGMRPLVAHCNLGLGKLYGRTGKLDQAHEHLATATMMYRDMGMRYWLEQAETEMRQLG